MNCVLVAQLIVRWTVMRAIGVGYIVVISTISLLLSLQCEDASRTSILSILSILSVLSILSILSILSMHNCVTSHKHS